MICSANCSAVLRFVWRPVKTTTRRSGKSSNEKGFSWTCPEPLRIAKEYFGARMGSTRKRISFFNWCQTLDPWRVAVWRLRSPSDWLRAFGTSQIRRRARQRIAIRGDLNRSQGSVPVRMVWRFLGMTESTGFSLETVGLVCVRL